MSPPEDPPTGIVTQIDDTNGVFGLAMVCHRQAIEREVISNYQIAQSLGFNGDFRAWEHLLRIQ
jgi:hypothetical protein